MATSEEEIKFIMEVHAKCTDNGLFMQRLRELYTMKHISLKAYNLACELYAPETLRARERHIYENMGRRAQRITNSEAAWNREIEDMDEPGCGASRGRSSC